MMHYQRKERTTFAIYPLEKGIAVTARNVFTRLTPSRKALPAELIFRYVINQS